MSKGKGKAVPLQAWSGPEGSRKLRFPDFMTTAQDGGKVVSLTYLLYRVSQEERAKLREGVPYVKLYRYNPKHLYPKLNGYGDNGQRKVWTSCISA